MKKSLLSIRGSLLLAMLATLIFCWPFLGERPQTSAKACWTNVLIECFDSSRTFWPWVKPTGSGRQWRIFPNLPNLTWGVQERVYSVGLESYCGEDDIQACWCVGGPGTEDPDFDLYPANLNTYMTYGPLNLTTAQFGRVKFSLYLDNAMDLSDSIFWGADSVFSLGTTPTHVWVDSSLGMETALGWVTITMDLADLNRMNGTSYNGPSVSALGRPAVYVFWWFKSNNNAQRGIGGFIDDVIVAWDDGALDCRGGGMQLREPDSLTMPEQVIVGDTVFAQFTWNTCDGGSPQYPPFHVQFLQDDEVLVDSVVTDVPPGLSQTWWSPPLIFDTDGEHTISVVTDAMGEVAEGNENNNITNLIVTVIPINDPPTFTWLAPGPQAPDGGDTIFAYSSAMLRWECFDPDDDANVSIYYDTDTEGCVGPFVPGGMNLTENDGVDSLNWSVTTFLPGTVRWPYAQVMDPQNFLCVYAPYPMQVMSTGVGDEILVPVTFHMAQNYPNPFNPSTDIEFGITRTGATTLKVFDLLGREIRTLVDNNLTPGIYHAHFDAGPDLASGVYLYRLNAPEGTLQGKMILMK